MGVQNEGRLSSIWTLANMGTALEARVILQGRHFQAHGFDFAEIGRTMDSDSIFHASSISSSESFEQRTQNHDLHHLMDLIL